MAKKKKFKLSKTQKQKLRSLSVLLAVGLGALCTGIIGTNMAQSRQKPRNIVWAADNTVQLPKDLKNFLLTQDNCKNYRGKDTPTGVGLWGVYQTSKKSYAKIAYGCSWSLTNYIMAVKTKTGWQLLDPNKYFAPFTSENSSGKGVLPYCSAVEQSKIPKDIESFCIKADGTAQANTL